jgi:histidinol dehydrogenase/sulfopropanediol 3-dehydrogenase
MASQEKYLKEAGSMSDEIDQEVIDIVRDILDNVRARGDDALFEYTAKFDDVELDDLRVSDEEIAAAGDKIPDEHREAIDKTTENVTEFHEDQRDNIQGFEREFKPGISMGQRVLPVETAGVYIPGGRHPLIATPAMTIVPAVVAGVDKVVACAPPQEDGTVSPAQLYAMDQAGADEIYSIGGAQAIGAMAFGTESVPNVDMLTGPGNVFVTEAKRQAVGRVGIDFLAGPTEVLILADESVSAELVAIDLLSQAEHDPNSRPILVTTSESLGEEVMEEIEKQLPDLRTEETARECWNNNGEILVVPDRETAVERGNEYAMEHTQLLMENPRELMEDLHNYGSLFIGPHAPVVFGDKAVGTNHALPTGRVARYSSGIWVGTYLKTPTHQELTAEGAASIADHAATICEIERTHGHQISAEVRRHDVTEEIRRD